jgi:hypothetical protein
MLAYLDWFWLVDDLVDVGARNARLVLLIVVSAGADVWLTAMPKAKDGVP